jgi:hypothetical protein
MRKTPKNFTGGLVREGARSNDDYARSQPRPGGGIGPVTPVMWTCSWCGVTVPRDSEEQAAHSCKGAQFALKRQKEFLASQALRANTPIDVCRDCHVDLLPGIGHRCEIKEQTTTNVTEGERLAAQLARAGYRVEKIEDAP